MVNKISIMVITTIVLVFVLSANSLSFANNETNESVGLTDDISQIPNDRTSDNWIQRNHDSSWTSRSSSHVPNTNKILWTFEADMDWPPIIIDKTIYLGLSNGTIYSLDSNDGNILNIIDQYTGSHLSHLAFYNNNIILSHSYGVSCFNIDDEQEQWSFKPRSNETFGGATDPLIHDGDLYVGISTVDILTSTNVKFGIFRLDINSGKVIWEYPTIGPSQVSSVSDGRVYIYNERTPYSIDCVDEKGNQDVTIINYATTDLIWRFETDERPSLMAYSSEKIFFGASIFGSNHMYCLDGRNGDELWNYSYGDDRASWGIPSIGFDGIYIGCRGKTLPSMIFKFNISNGNIIWKTETDSKISQIANADNKVLGASLQQLYCINEKNGEVIWTYETGFGKPISIGNGKIFIPSDYPISPSVLFCFGNSSYVNDKPTITNISASSISVNVNESVRIDVYVQDLDSDNFTYEYNITGGRIEGNGSSVTWIAPDFKGIFYISVRVINGFSFSDWVTINITTIVPLLNSIPIISNITTDPKIFISGETVDVTINAYDPDGDELTYVVEPNEGKIVGSGSSVKWILPSIPGNYILIINVTDINDSSVEKIFEFSIIARDTDNDGKIDDEDSFVNDPSASKDTDNDGYPDRWNDGKSQDDSTTGLTLDTFPDNSDEWNDTDEDGVGDNTDLFPQDPNDWEDSDNDSVGDNSDKFPDDPAASIDEDGDSFPDEWNPGMDEDDSTTGLKLDLFPDDPDEWADSDEDGIGDNSDQYPDDPDNGATDNGSDNDDHTFWILLAVLMIGIAAAGIFFFRRKEPEEEEAEVEPLEDDG